MKKQAVLLGLFSFFLLLGTTESVQAQKAGKFTSFNQETDEMGVTGEYFGMVDKRDFGFRFVKESGGKMVNELHYFEKKGSEPQLILSFKENYYTKNKVKLFYKLTGSSASSYVELIEIDPGVFAQISTDYNNNGNAVPPEAKRKVVDLYAKNKASFTTWNLETAQAKVEAIMMALNTEQLEKIKASLMKFDSYSNYKGKIAFTKGSNYFRNTHSNQPVEKLESFITKAELGNVVAYKPYFEQPIMVSHPGAWFNISYEMLGEKADREALRKSSTFYAQNIPAIDKYKDEFYLPGRGAIDNNGSVDYAFLELLRLVQNKVKEGGIYDLKVTVWAFKDGQNIAPLAEGTIQLEYTKEASGTKGLLFDPVNGWVSKIEKWLAE